MTHDEFDDLFRDADYGAFIVDDVPKLQALLTSHGCGHHGHRAVTAFWLHYSDMHSAGWLDVDCTALRFEQLIVREWEAWCADGCKLPLNG